MDHQGSLQNFEIQKKLGQGAFGQVFVVKRKLDNQIYALKKVILMGMKQKEKDNALNQIRILASLNDQYIVKFKQAFFDNPTNTLCIVMEYAKGGDLMKLINNHIKSHSRIDQKQIWKALVDILKGLKSLHDKKIMHRDLKAANIFISEDGKYKLGDLNVSKVLKKGLAYTQTGTPYYASPEVWQDKPYDMKSDIWSLGCVIYQMAVLDPPFKASDLSGLYKKVLTGQYKPIPSTYSSDLSQIIGFMLKVNPKSRLGTDDLLKHPTVKKRCGGEVLQMANNSLSNQDQLLKTIKFNPHNLNSINTKLPKSSYGKDDGSRKSKQRNDSIDSLDNLRRDRALSACGIRNQNRFQSPAVPKQDIYSNRNIQPQLIQNGQRPPGMNLPPKPTRKTQKTEESNYKPQNQRLRRGGQQILGGQRSSSVNR